MTTKNMAGMLMASLLLVSFSCGGSKEKSGKVPIDCPLEKQGVDTHNLKPFKDVAKYIEFLERKDRAAWQKPDAVISSMGLKGAEIIADIGAGSGYFSFRFAAALPKGKVYAIDPEPEMVRHIHHKIMSGGPKNIEAVLGSYDDPKVPGNSDLIFICDVLHHVKDRPAWLSKLYGGMKKGSKVVLIEFKEGSLPEGPPEKVKISARELAALFSGAGFALAKQDGTLLPYQNYFEFVK